MNIQEMEILKALSKGEIRTQRDIAVFTGISIGSVNKSLRSLENNGYIKGFSLTERGDEAFLKSKPKNAIILAAGLGMRMVPLNTNTPKALLKVHGEVLIERCIRFLKEAGIKNIFVVTGYLKEQFEYLIDDFNVKLIINEHYTGNNLHSLFLAKDHLENAYIVPCDIYMRKNPFSNRELYSWYMVSDENDPSSTIRISRKKDLVISNGGCKMIGLSYITGERSRLLKDRLTEYDSIKKYDNSFWEEALLDENAPLFPRLEKSSDFVEINTYEELRELDSDSGSLHSEAFNIIKNVLSCESSEIKDIGILKKGMTNRSFLFTVRNERFIMRIPGEGTEYLINRKNEAENYRSLNSLGISDEILFIDPETGIKISRYYDQSRVCDPKNIEDVKKCMHLLKNFHDKKLKVPHTFDLFSQIDFYESLREEKSVYRDYGKTRENVFSLKNYIDKVKKEYSLSHIDAVPDNFLFTKEGLRLIDWEYAGMQDPDLDIAMFSIYSFYNKEEIDRLIDIYYEGNVSLSTRIKIYCYVSASGLLWSNWCEYKRHLGVEFGEYSIRQYRYAKDFYKIASQEIALISF